MVGEPHDSNQSMPSLDQIELQSVASGLVRRRDFDPDVGGSPRSEIARQPGARVIAVDHDALVVGQLRAEPDHAAAVALIRLGAERAARQVLDVRGQRDRRRRRGS